MKPIYILKSALAAALIAATALSFSGCGKEVALKVRDNSSVTNIKAKTGMTVSEALSNAKIELGSRDIAEPSRIYEITDKTEEIVIRRYAKVKVYKNSSDVTVEVFGGTVEDALDKAGIKGYGFKRAYLCRWRNEAHLLRVVDWAIKNKINIIYYKYYSDFLPPSSFILKAHENNIAINCFSLNKVSQYEQMTELGINGVICNKILFTYDPLLNPAFVPPTEPPTEAPTKAPTEPPTEAPTETPTASSTVPVTEPVQEPSETATA